MTALTGRVERVQSGGGRSERTFRVADASEPLVSSRSAMLVRDHRPAKPGYDLYLVAPDVETICVPSGGDVVQLPRALRHLDVGDVVDLAPDSDRLTVMWKAAHTHNSVLLTEQCDHRCLMCSQPPKQRDDRWLFRRAEAVVDLLPPSTASLGLTGGEPTLHPDELLALLRTCRDRLPATSVHLLSNGRRFADVAFARAYAQLKHPDLMVGIPLYAPTAALHDWIVQSDGAFEQTVRGILTLVGFEQRVEVRIVIQRGNVDVLPELARFIARNLPFVDQVALMGLEMTGYARPNRSLVWVDPSDYREQLREAALALSSAGVTTKIYNHQLCVVDEDVWHLCVSSISDWKQTYAEPCERCDVRDRCGGVFATSKGDVSAHLRAFRAMQGAPASAG